MVLDTDDPERNHDQEQESVLPTTSSSREWDKPRKSVEFSPSSTKRVSSVQQPTISEAERTLEGNGPSIEFPNKGQGIVFPSSELLPVNYPEENVGKEKEILNNSEQLENNKIDSIISSSSNREDSSRSLSTKQSTRAGTFRPGPEQEVGDGSELFETSSKDQKQETNSEQEFDSNLVDDEARVAPQILAANIPSYHPSYPNRDLKPNDQKDSPVSSPNSSSKDNLPTRSVVESRLVVVVGSLTVIALVLVLLVMLLLCR